MSFNIARYGDKKPNAEGKLSLGIDDLANVGSVQLGETLKYNSSNDTWEAASAGGGIPGLNFALFGQGQTNDYSNSTFTMSVGSTLGFYDTAPINYLSSHVTFNYVGQTSWLESITLASGSYEIFAQTQVNFSSSGYFGFRVSSSQGGYISELALIGDVQTTYGHPTAIMTNIKTEQEIDIRFRVLNVANVAASQGIIPSQYGVILIRSAQ